MEHSLCTHKRCAEPCREGYKHEKRVDSVTRTLENRYSPDIMSKPKKTSQFMEKIVVGCAPRLQNLPCKDLSGMFKDCDGAEGTPSLDQIVRTCNNKAMVGLMKDRALKGHKGVRDCIGDGTLTPSLALPQGKKHRGQTSDASSPSLFLLKLDTCMCVPQQG